MSSSNKCKVIAFVTSNVNKIKEIETLLLPAARAQATIDAQFLPVTSLTMKEIQDSKAENITKHKLMSAVRQLYQR